MIAINMASAGLMTLVVIGIGMLCIEAGAFLGYALDIIDRNELIATVPAAALSSMVFDAKKIVIPCNSPPEDCVFSGYRQSDLNGKLVASSDQVYLHQNVIFNATIFNDFMGNASDFTVTLYENIYNNINQLINTIIIGSQTISFLESHNNTTINFNWIANSPGTHYFSMLIDPDNDINETNDANNEATTLLNVIALPDLIPKLETPQEAHMNRETTINAEITNYEPMLAGNFQVTLLENCTPPDENGNMEFIEIGSQTIHGIT
jgi:hypothetical protein